MTPSCGGLPTPHFWESSSVRAIVFTVGAWFLTQDIDGDVKVQTTWRTFVTPVMLSCVAAVILTLLGIHHAPILGDALNTLGSITTPAALLIIG